MLALKLRVGFKMINLRMFCNPLLSTENSYGSSRLPGAEEDKVVVVRWAWASVYQPNLLLGQLGLAFMVLLVRGNFWEEAGHVLAQLSRSLQVDFTSVKLPAIGIFLDLNQVNDT